MAAYAGGQGCAETEVESDQESGNRRASPYSGGDARRLELTGRPRLPRPTSASTGAIKFDTKWRIHGSLANVVQTPEGVGGLALRPNLARPVAGGFMMRTTALEGRPAARSSIVAIGVSHGGCVLFWGYLLAGAGIDMSAWPTWPMDPEPWSPAQALLMFAMWWVMMIAMMVPSAAPTILLFATIKRRQAIGHDSPVISSWLFLAGYLVIWAGFSPVAVSVQWGLEHAGLLSGMMASTSSLLAGIISACRRALPTHADQARLSSILPEPGAIPLNVLGNRTLWRALRMGFRRLTASAVAGS